jgi:S-adenosylmethionine synthetase
MARDLMKLLTLVIAAKRDLKQIYYTSRNKESKQDTKELVSATIGVQKLLEELIDLGRKRRIVKKLLADRKAELTIRMWSLGLPKRIKDFVDKTKNLEQQHLTKYSESLLQYIDSIGQELAKWIEDINTLAEIPKPPRG